MRIKVNSITLLGLLIGLVSSSSFATSNNDLLDGMSNCLKVQMDEARLACFDQLAQLNRVVLNANKSNNIPIAETVIKEEEKKIDDFSKEDLIKAEEEKGLESISSTISGVKQLIRGQWVIDLENGQKWQQKDYTEIKLKVTDKVNLKKGAFGAVSLLKEGSNRSIKVKRLK